MSFLVPPSMFLHWRVSMYLMSSNLIRLETLKPHLVPCPSTSTPARGVGDSCGVWSGIPPKKVLVVKYSMYYLEHWVVGRGWSTKFTIVSLGIPSHRPKYHFDDLTMYVDLPKSLWKDLVRCEFWMSKTLPLEGWSKEAPDFGIFWRCFQITNLQNHRTFLGKETILERNLGVPFWDKVNLLDVFLFKSSI